MADARRAIFLDRDGVLNADHGYTHRVEDLALLPGVAAALRELKARGFLLIVVTNQSGVARGLYTVEDVHRFHAAMSAEIERHGGKAPDDFFLCPHLPDAAIEAYRKDCDCRKPAPGMIYEAQKKYGLDLARSYLVGDRASDVAAAVAAGVRAVQVVHPGDTADPRAIAAVASLADALPLF